MNARPKSARTCSRLRSANSAPLRTRFGQRLQALRIAAGKGPDDVAGCLAMSQARLESIESGIEEIDLPLIAQFARSLNVSIAALFRGL